MFDLTAEQLHNIFEAVVASAQPFVVFLTHVETDITAAGERLVYVDYTVVNTPIHGTVMVTEGLEVSCD